MYLSDDQFCLGCRQDLLRDCRQTLNPNREHPCAVVAQKAQQAPVQQLGAGPVHKCSGDESHGGKFRTAAWQRI
jgi:hypothetical protein